MRTVKELQTELHELEKSAKRLHPDMQDLIWGAHHCIRWMLGDDKWCMSRFHNDPLNIRDGKAPEKNHSPSGRACKMTMEEARQLPKAKGKT